MTILSGNQPCYLPYVGLFSRIAQSDIHMHCPYLQFVKRMKGLGRRSWHNSNIITDNRWLTVPVHVPRKRPPASLAEVKIAHDGWSEEHLWAIREKYGEMKYFDLYYPGLAAIIGWPWNMLALLNQALIQQICEWLEIKTTLIDSANWHWEEGDATEKNIRMCRIVGADTYLQSINGKEFTDEERMKEAGIKVKWHHFVDHYYGQDISTNLGRLSVIDLLFRQGPNAAEFIRR